MSGFMSDLCQVYARFYVRFYVRFYARVIINAKLNAIIIKFISYKMVITCIVLVIYISLGSKYIATIMYFYDVFL